MTGIIVELTRGRRSGAIRAQDGSRVSFLASSVQGDFETLAVGHRVRFDVDGEGPVPSASHVHRDTTHASIPKKSPLDLRYAGFEQAQNGVRSYRFAAVSSGVPARHFIVTVDTALMRNYHIGVQEAPALCMRKLAADLERAPSLEAHILGNDDLLAYADSRAALAARKKSRTPFRAKRGSPPPRSS